MLIGNKYKIEADKYNIIVFLKHTPKNTDSEEYWTREAFFRTLEQALKYIVDQGVKETELKEFRAVVEKQETLYKLINSLKDLPKQELVIHHVKEDRDQ